MYEAIEHYKVYKQKQKAKQKVAPIIKLIFKTKQYERLQYNKKQR